jgi:7-cyano-7-deazaguanine synthase
VHETALVLFSGGQDSTTCLAWALQRYSHVETIGFSYGQRHSVELVCRPQILSAIRKGFPDWAFKLGEDYTANLDVVKEISDTALTRDVEISMGSNGLPTTFVPGRNLMFLVTAAAFAYRRGISVLVAGVCETDFSGYPDCRDDTVKAVQLAINLGMERRFVIETPLMWIDKAATWTMARNLGGDPLVEVIKESTHTCYMGDRSKKHTWGYGCGTCPACELRANGYEQFAAQ